MPAGSQPDLPPTFARASPARIAGPASADLRDPFEDMPRTVEFPTRPQSPRPYYRPDKPQQGLFDLLWNGLDPNAAVPEPSPGGISQAGMAPPWLGIPLLFNRAAQVARTSPAATTGGGVSGAVGNAYRAAGNWGARQGFWPLLMGGTIIQQPAAQVADLVAGDGGGPVGPPLPPPNMTGPAAAPRPELAPPPRPVLEQAPPPRPARQPNPPLPPPGSFPAATGGGVRTPGAVTAAEGPAGLNEDLVFLNQTLGGTQTPGEVTQKPPSRAPAVPGAGGAAYTTAPGGAALAGPAAAAAQVGQAVPPTYTNAPGAAGVAGPAVVAFQLAQTHPEVIPNLTEAGRTLAALQAQGVNTPQALMASAIGGPLALSGVKKVSDELGVPPDLAKGFWQGLAPESKVLVGLGIGLTVLPLLMNLFGGDEEGGGGLGFLGQVLPFLGVGMTLWGGLGGTFGQLPEFKRLGQEDFWTGVQRTIGLKQ